MKTALNAAVALMVCTFMLAGTAAAQDQAAPAPPPAPESVPQPPPGIMLTPPRGPSADTQQSCPADPSRKLELIV